MSVSNSLQPVLYKYTTYRGAKAIIQNSSLKLSVPKAFNDPFDILLEEALGSELDDFLAKLMPDFFEFTAGPVDYNRLRPGSMRCKVIKINSALKDARPETVTAIREELIRVPPDAVWDIQAMHKMNRKVVARIQDELDRYGIFCSSKHKQSLLMWSHYADHHKGAVIELKPDVKNDSALLASKPVRYSDERPLLYRTSKDLVEHALLMPAADSARQMVHDLIYTKSVEWGYEGEYRLAIPDFVPSGATEDYLPLRTGEISAIYFGCRMLEDEKREIKSLARKLDPGMSFYKAIMAKRDYALDWELDDG